MPFGNKIVPLFFFGLLTLLSCVKLGYLLRFEQAGLEHTLELIRTILIALFLYVVLFSYLMRSEPRVKSAGLLERWLPIFVTLFVPVYGMLLMKIKGIPPLPIYFTGLLLHVYGWALAIRALWFFKYSFSIMAEVRNLVTSGPYQRVRHPLYFAELVMLAGFTLMVFNFWAVLAYFAVIYMQVVRARVEEGKLAAAYPEDYEKYRRNSGFFIPVPGRKHDKSENKTQQGEVGCLSCLL